MRWRTSAISDAERRPSGGEAEPPSPERSAERRTLGARLELIQTTYPRSRHRALIELRTIDCCRALRGYGGHFQLGSRVRSNCGVESESGPRASAREAQEAAVCRAPWLGTTRTDKGERRYNTAASLRNRKIHVHQVMYVAHAVIMLTRTMRKR